MAELTNAQVALQAAVTSSRRSDGGYYSTQIITDRADKFVLWLDNEDKEF